MLKIEMSGLGQNPMLAELAVAEALSYRHLQALLGELDWAAAVAERPSKKGRPEMIGTISAWRPEARR